MTAVTVETVLPSTETFPFAGPPQKFMSQRKSPPIMGAEFKITTEGSVVMTPRYGRDTRDRRPQGGVYGIAHVPSGRLYVGATGIYMVRWRSHLVALRGHRHPVKGLQRDWDGDGPDAFRFCILQRIQYRRGSLMADLRTAERSMWELVTNAGLSTYNVVPRVRA